MKYNIFKKIIWSALLLSTVFSPVLLSAETASTTPDTGKGICVQISAWSEKKMAAVLDKQTKFEANYALELKKQQDKQTAADTILQNERDAADQAFQREVSTLSSQASSTAEVQAITAFQNSVESARNIRKAGIDAAIKAFRDGVSAALDLRKATIDTAILNFQTSIKTALDKAQADCMNSVAGETIRANLKLAFDTAQQKLLADKLSAIKIGASADSLTKIRRDSIKKILSDYKVAIRKAKVDLRIVFPAKKK
ncbi:MAG: hypothetical protein PHV42_01575 [Candidatus Pacebacteria bacterium]|nr:hypothetical protein [Candidatus Paceibacterota bacterium]